MEFRECPYCNNKLEIEAKFCGFCGKQFQDAEASKPPVKKAHRSFKQISFVTIFLLYLSLSYFTGMGNMITDFHERSVELEIPISELQGLFIDSLIYIFDFIFSAFFVGLFAYWFKGRKTWIYLGIGFLMKYWVGLLLIGIYVLKGQFSVNDWPDSFLYMLLFSVIAVLSGSYLGAKIAGKYSYSEENDRTKFFFFGLSKKFWFLMTIAYNPILQFINKLSVFVFYMASKSISEATNWSEFFSAGYIWGVVIVVLMPFVAFAVSLKLFSIGIKAVKNKQTKYRKLKIAIFMIAIPLLIVLIPIMRNRTWFF